MVSLIVHALLAFVTVAAIIRLNPAIFRRTASSRAKTCSDTSCTLASSTLAMMMPRAVALSTAMLSTPLP